MLYDVADRSNIVIVENFISKKHLDELYRYCYLINEWESQSVSGTDKISTSTTMKSQSPSLHEVMLDYVNKLQQMIEYKFGRKLEPGSLGIRRWDEGEFQDLHADGESFDGVPNDTYIVDYGSVIYINDNYSGGELYFPAYNICFRPPAGTLVFFPSSTYYLHGVKTVTGGVRYTSPHFWVPVKHRKLIETVQTAEDAKNERNNIPQSHS